MGYEEMRVAVFLTPAAVDFSYADGIIRELSAKLDATLFEPHLTVCSGFCADPELLKRVLAEAAQALPPLTLRVRGVGCSEAYFRTLYIEFEPDPLLIGLRERVGVAVERPDNGFLPHLSLLYREMPLAEKESLARRLHLGRKEITFDSLKVVTPANIQDGWRDTHRWATLYRAELRKKRPETPLRAVLFDFGGVLAEEGFREGLYAIARSQGLDPVTVYRTGMDEVYRTGYVLGQGSEADFWQTMRERCGIKGEDEELSREILDRFVLRPTMIEAVRSLMEQGITVAILSDQTDWLERLNRRDNFMASFDRVYNSYRLGKGKRDPSLFDDVVCSLGLAPGEALFVDDLPGNVARAAARGLRTILFRDEVSFLADLKRIGFQGEVSEGGF